ncbi:MAG: flavodoxin family protein [Candidatus Aminicenantaceae bacterium]
MSKILVMYYSQTGNTQLVAEAIFETLKGDKSIKSLKELTDGEIASYSLIFAGFPVHSHSVPPVATEFLKAIPQRKKVAFFSTHGSLKGSPLSREALENATVLAAGARVLGTFSCRGRVSLQALDVLMRSPEHKTWSEMAISANTHPDESDLAEARDFAARILTLASQD